MSALSGDICRVCRCEGTPDRPLYHPCICTGSIKYIHQECLLQWLNYSKKEFCELCNHRFSFTPIYAADMPARLPVSILLSGFISTAAHAVRFWLHYVCVMAAWVGFVPLTAFRVYKMLFANMNNVDQGSGSSVNGSTSVLEGFSLSNVMGLVNAFFFDTENLFMDVVQGIGVVALTLLAFIFLVWLREQIMHGGGPEWMENEQVEHNHDNVDLPPELPDEPVEPEPEDEAEVQGEDRENIAEEVQDDVAGAGGLPQHMEDELEAQWNPVDWDRNGPQNNEELTWERLIGLDGSFAYLEHVFWVFTLNSVFITIFAFIPYHIGRLGVHYMELQPSLKSTHFEGLITTLMGYCQMAMWLVTLHALSKLLRLKALARFAAFSYVVVKVALLLVLEVLAFPVICGWWLDICSLALFDSSIKDREASYHQSPASSVFIHWMVGMVYVFYFASFVILLREVLRPGVLWFLRNLNDPDFNPVQEMIHLSVPRHLRRFCSSLLMFGLAILAMFYVPSKIIKKTMPNFLPYQTTMGSESRVDELAMELLLLLVIMPAMQDQNNTRKWLKTLIRAWCLMSAHLLGLHSYLFGDEPQEQEQGEGEEAEAQQEEGDAENNNAEQERMMDLGAMHNALLQQGEASATAFQPYVRPNFFHLRILGLLVLMIISLLLSALICMVLPVWVGRMLFSLFFPSDTPTIYELYTAAIGLYVCFLAVKTSASVTAWLQQGWAKMSEKLSEWMAIGLKAIVAFSLLVGLVPLLYGLLLDVVILTPVRVSLWQSPVLFLWQDWALGAMYTKITVALTFMGPDWWLKEEIERFYRNGIRGIEINRLIYNLVIPTCRILGLALALPYIAAKSVAPLFIESAEMLILLERRIYPALLGCLIVFRMGLVQIRQCKKLYEHIKNDRYLVGRRLVNYTPSVAKASD